MFKHHSFLSYISRKINGKKKLFKYKYLNNGKKNTLALFIVLKKIKNVNIFMKFSNIKTNNKYSNIKTNNKYFFSKSFLEKHYLILQSNRLKNYFENITSKDLLYKYNIQNMMALPKFKKIIINVSSSNVINDKKYLIPLLLALELISGQKLKITKAKKSIASFKLKKNAYIGCKITLKNQKMFIFLDKLITILLPRLRDYKGYSLQKFKNPNTYTLGIENLLLFPELENHFDFFEHIKGLHITIVLSTSNSNKIKSLISSIQIPLNS